MACSIRKVSYFYTSVEDEPGEAYKVLAQLANLDFNLQAFSAVPTGPHRTQLTLFPADAARFANMVPGTGLHIDGPHSAILVQGDDQLGALAGVHEKLANAGVNVFASTAVTDGKGSYGYLIYVRPDDMAQAMTALTEEAA